MARSKKGAESKTEPLVIINPAAGSGAGHDLFRHREHELLDVIGEFELRFTSQRGDAETITAHALREGPRDIFVVGGDGTINEVVNGMFAGESPAHAAGSRLALLGGGTGSDLMRTLGLDSFDNTLEAIRDRRSIEVDVAKVVCQCRSSGSLVERLYVNIASFGLSSMANLEVSRFSAIGGSVAYAAATAWSLIGWSNPRVRITYSNAEGALRAYEGAVVMGAFANGRYFGSGMLIAPGAELADGLLNMVLVGDMRRRDIVRFARHLYDGSHIKHPDVVSAVATRVDVEGPANVMIEADGDVLGHLPASFELSPHTLSVVA